ncbi:MAG: hypothetical protein DHS20C18_08870 [Saprospiraceae bacterium]|nr:MAG: hypothetical protein DHS20C18_08870 [Saprospiraceae bacterium]
MKSNIDLYNLIKAMSKSEKRYFTLDAQKTNRKGSKYLDLFQAIKDMDIYDEEKLKKKFGVGLPHDKIYLYEAILRSMRDYRSSTSISAQIREMILDSKYLYERGLYEQCQDRLQTARDLARDLDDQLALLEINKEERSLVWQNRKKYYEKDIDQLANQSRLIRTSFSEEMLYLDLYEDLSKLVMRQFELKDEKEKTNLREKYAEFLEKARGNTISSRAQRRYFQCQALYHQLLGDFDNVYKYYYMVVDWWNANPKYRDEEFYRYIVDISNLLHACSVKGQYHYLPDLLQTLESSSPKNIHDKGVVFQKVAIYKLMYHINSGDFEGVDLLLDKIDVGLTQFRISKGSKLVLIFNVVCLLFVFEDFKLCISWADRILKKEKTSSRQDIQRAIRIVQVIAYLEMEMDEELESTIRAYQRYFQKNGLSRDAFEFRMISHLNRYYLAPLNEQKQELVNIQKYLTGLKEDKSVHIPFGLDDLFSYWANARLNKQPIREVFYVS